MDHPLDRDDSLEGDKAAKQKPKRRFRFGLRLLFYLPLLAAALIWAYREPLFRPPVVGTWELQVPQGTKHRLKIISAPKSMINYKDQPWGKSPYRRYHFGGSTVFAGIYELQGKRLVVSVPEDSRMKGLVWEWDDKQWTLVAEPPSHPTGGVYLGAVIGNQETRRLSQIRSKQAPNNDR